MNYQRIVLFIWVFIQQALVACGTFMLARLASATGDNLIPSTRLYSELALLALCMLMSGSFIQLKILLKANKVFFNYLERIMRIYIDNNKNKPRNWRNEEAKVRCNDPVTRSFWDVSSEKVTFEYDTFALVLNIVFNTLAVGLATGWILGVSLLGTIFLGMVFVHFNEQKIDEVSTAEQTAQNNLQKTLNLNWDSITLGNSYFLNQYQNILNLKFKDTYNRIDQCIKVKQGSIAFISFFTNFIVLAAAFIQWRIDMSEGLGVRVLVLLPRTFQIVYHGQIFQSYWMQWKALKSKLNLIQNALTATTLNSVCDPLDYVRIEKINIELNGNKITFKELMEYLNQISLDNKIENYKGCIRITGENGSGKSSLLLKLKELLGEVALYLPANHQLILETVSSSNSSGERDIKFIEKCVEIKPKVLILDEWDAHLSQEKTKIVRKNLNEFCKESLLIEVVHSKRDLI